MDRRMAGVAGHREDRPAMIRSESCRVSTPLTQERGKQMRRKRFQKGSLQARKHGRHRVWVAFWWEDGVRRCKMLGRQSQMTKAEAEAVLSAILREINSGSGTSGKAGLHVRAVRKRRVPAVLPPQLEGIDRGHLGTDRQVASHTRVREGLSFTGSGARSCRIFWTERRSSYQPASFLTCGGF